jgi:hypothetical protein
MPYNFLRWAAGVPGALLHSPGDGTQEGGGGWAPPRRLSVRPRRAARCRRLRQARQRSCAFRGRLSPVPHGLPPQRRRRSLVGRTASRSCGRHHVLMRVGKSDMCVPTVAARHLHKGVATRARKRVRKTTHVSFLPPMTGNKSRPHRFGLRHSGRMQRSNRWRKTKRITSTAAARWNA